MENDVTYPTPTAARSRIDSSGAGLVITGCIAALMLLWQFLPAIEAWFSPHETNASARKRGLRPSGSSVTDVEPRVKLHKA